MSHSAIGLARRTNEGQPDQACNSNDQAHDIEQEMLVVVHTNTSVHPWTVAMENVSYCDSLESHSAFHLLILPRHTTSTTPAVLASQGFPYHTWCTEMFLVEDAIFD